MGGASGVRTLNRCGTRGSRTDCACGQGEESAGFKAFKDVESVKEWVLVRRDESL